MKYSIEDTTLIAIADSIRAKTGGTDGIMPKDMPTEIESIETGGGTEEIENIIDESGVLDSTDGTATEKVEQLIDKAEDGDWWYNFTATITSRDNLRFMNYQGETIPKVSLENMQGLVGTMFKNCRNLKRIDFYINTCKGEDHDSFFQNCVSLEYVKGVNTSNSKYVTDLLVGCNSLKTVEEPFDLTNCRSSSRGAIVMASNNSIPIEELRFVPNTIYFNFVATYMPNLSAGSVQSLFDGLNPTVTGQVLTLPTTFNKPEAEAVVSANIEVVDGVTRIKGKEGWTLVR